MSLRQKNYKSLRMTMIVMLLLLPLTAGAWNMELDKVLDFDHVLSYLVATLLISTFVLLFYNRLITYREQETKAESHSQNSRLALVLQTGNLHLWLYNAITRHYIILSETGEYSKEYNPIEYSQFFNRDDFEVMRSLIFDICEGRRQTASISLRSVINGNEQRHYEITISIAKRDEQNNITTLLGIQHDVTDDLAKQKKVNELLMRYHTVFNTSLIDMIYYDSNGVLRDINEKACQTFGVPNRQMVMGGNFLLQNNPMFNNIEFDRIENTRTTSIVDFRQYQDAVYRLDDFGLSGKMYYESTINPIRNEQGKLEGIYMAGRNVTEMVESFHHQQEGAKQLALATKSIQEYITNINYALRVSDVRLVNYYPSSYTMEISTNINKTQLQLSQLRCIRLGAPRFRRTVSSVLNQMDHSIKRPIETTIETEIRDQKHRQIWLMFHLVPMFDDQGHVERYFGICRNVTDMVETEQRLAIETKKAQETELLKQSFLTNMSYEIRTPLNTVVGFAELFEAEHDVADEPIFVEEIKRNSNSLLQLVNDILFLSRLDAHMIECTKEYIDFAQIFESHCQVGWSGINPNVKATIENPYEHLVVNIDHANVGKVIQKLCIHAVNFTHEGSIRAKYDYRHGELTISIEDTGVGIDEQTLPRVFERFVRNKKGELCGTGLDLPIVKALVELMGGSIEFQSALDRGTTAWVSIPCIAKTLEKRSGTTS